MSEPIAFYFDFLSPHSYFAFAQRFADEGFRVLLNARNADRIEALARSLPDAAAIPADFALSEGRASLIKAVLEHRTPAAVINNAVGGTFGDYLTVDPADMRHNFAVNVEAVLNLALGLIPAMIDNGGGSFLATGNTSAYRRKPNFAGFAPTKAAQRILLESIARSAGLKGAHVGYVAIDAVIDLEWTRQSFSAWRNPRVEPVWDFRWQWRSKTQLAASCAATLGVI